MAYDGPERRRGDAAMLARIDERTAAMRDVMDTLATKESVDHIGAALAAHLGDHKAHDSARQWKIATWISAAFAAAGLALNAMRGGAKP